MNAQTATVEPSWMVWVHRGRLALGTLVAWGVLSMLLDKQMWPGGMDNPAAAVLFSGPWLVAPLFLIALWLGTLVGTFLSGYRSVVGALTIASAGLALWLCRGGVMDKWLIDRNPLVDGPHGQAYVPLLGDYALLIVAYAGVIVIGARMAGQRLVEAVRLDDLKRHVPQALLAVATVVVIASALIWICNGRPEAATFRKQVWFALAVGFSVGAYAVRKMQQARPGPWLWATPFVVGVVGVVIAIARPAYALSPQYATNLNNIPALALVRALPAEMISVSVLAIIWASRSLREDREHRHA